MSTNRPPTPPRPEENMDKGSSILSLNENNPTESHALSKVKQDEKGLVQKVGETKEISDIGWGQEPAEIEEQIVSGLSNEDLWMLLRRFDQVRV